MIIRQIRTFNGDEVVILLYRQPWINLTINKVHILDWAKQFYANSIGTKVLGKVTSGEISPAACFISGTSFSKKIGFWAIDL